MTTNAHPRRGEIWDINLDQTRGKEVQKTRPAIVISSDTVAHLRVKIIIPVVDWKTEYAESPWHVLIKPVTANGLTKDSCADSLQVRGVSRERFALKLGRVTQLEMEEIINALGAVVEFS